MERSNVMITLRKRNEFASDSIIDDLNTLIKFKKGQKQNAQSLPEVNLNLAMSATSALIKYLDVNVFIILFTKICRLLHLYPILMIHLLINSFQFLIKMKINKKLIIRNCSIIKIIAYI